MLALLALTIGAFAIGTTEFVPMGLLPATAGDFGVTIPTAGYLTTGYALGVVAGAPLLAILGTRVSRKRMLMLLMTLFAAITYITPMMTEAAGYPESAITWLLVLFGIGMVAGNLIGGRYADRTLMPMLMTALAGLAVVLAAGLGVTAPNWIGALLATTALALAALSTRLDTRPTLGYRAVRPGRR